MSITIAIILIIIIVLIIVFVLYSIQDQIRHYNVRVEEGNFTILKENEWDIRPLVPTSKNTLLGIPTFEDDRYDTDLASISLLYGGKKIKKNEAWVIKGRIPHNLIYWNFGAYMLSDGVSEEYTPIEASINNRMIPSVKDGDDIVCIMSPSYKLADYIMREITFQEYRDKDLNKKHVIFRYFPIPNYNPNAYYNLIFNSYIHEDSSFPQFKVSKYISEEPEDVFKFYPVKPSTNLVLKNKNTLDENKLDRGSSFIERNLDNQIKKYKQKIAMKPVGPFSQDILYLSSDVIDIKNNDQIIVGAIDHSANGKCLYSEILFVDDVTGRCYDNQIVSRYDALNIETTSKIRIVQSSKPPSNRIRVIERICVDLSTKFRSDIETIIPAVVYIT